MGGTMDVERRRQAEQRLRRMLLDQSALQPNPYYLDTPPAGAVQRCHRGYVVQFMNEVHSTGTLGRPRPLAVPARVSTP